VSRTLLNRMQRDGIQVRMYSLLPGETVPCAVFPGDDLVVTALRADFSGVDAVTLWVTGPGDSPVSELHEVPVSGPAGEVLWATPATLVRQMPSMRLQLTLASAGATPAELGRYVLEHSVGATGVTILAVRRRESGAGNGAPRWAPSSRHREPAYGPGTPDGGPQVGEHADDDALTREHLSDLVEHRAFLGRHA
jgi:hypothetical protein